MYSIYQIFSNVSHNFIIFDVNILPQNFPLILPAYKLEKLSLKSKYVPQPCKREKFRSGKIPPISHFEHESKLP